MILTSERRAKLPFEGQKAQQLFYAAAETRKNWIELTILYDSADFCIKQRVAELVAWWLAVLEIQVQTLPGANQCEQIFVSLSCVVAYVMYYKVSDMNTLVDSY